MVEATKKDQAQLMSIRKKDMTNNITITNSAAVIINLAAVITNSPAVITNSAAVITNSLAVTFKQKFHTQRG